MNKWYPIYETEENETEKAETAGEPEKKSAVRVISEMILDSIAEVRRPELAEMDPQERRKHCADLAASYSKLYGNRTGRFFNAIAGAQGPKEEDEAALGRRIMEKRNVNYHPKEN